MGATEEKTEKIISLMLDVRAFAGNLDERKHKKRYATFFLGILESGGNESFLFNSVRLRFDFSDCLGRSFVTPRWFDYDSRAVGRGVKLFYKNSSLLEGNWRKKNSIESIDAINFVSAVRSFCATDGRLDFFIPISEFKVPPLSWKDLHLIVDMERTVLPMPAKIHITFSGKKLSIKD